MVVIIMQQNHKLLMEFIIMNLHHNVFDECAFDQYILCTLMEPFNIK